MGERNDGGPAFPGSAFNQGMTLRDWFAGQALSGLLVRDGTLNIDRERIAETVYGFADAMLAKRSKP